MVVGVGGTSDFLQPDKTATAANAEINRILEVDMTISMMGTCLVIVVMAAKYVSVLPHTILTTVGQHEREIHLFVEHSIVISDCGDGEKSGAQSK